MILRTVPMKLGLAMALALTAPAAGSVWWPQPAEAAAPALQGVLNLNTASQEQLVLLPGVGESRAQAIMALRKQRGSFKKVDELVDVKGIGDAALAKLRPFVKLDGATTLRVD
ncbi:MAG: helix-hairpin-helix domain-containing protein [bacterium]|nr:helix-hairpin-helix domain-containing protein [bacterium]MCP5067295.1 helix-hairpin-helix domain-containing protein [bacterium]